MQRFVGTHLIGTATPVLPSVVEDRVEHVVPTRIGIVFCHLEVLLAPEVDAARQERQHKNGDTSAGITSGGVVNWRRTTTWRYSGGGGVTRNKTFSAVAVFAITTTQEHVLPLRFSYNLYRKKQKTNRRMPHGARHIDAALINHFAINDVFSNAFQVKTNAF